MRLFGFEISRVRSLPEHQIVCIAPDGRPRRVLDITPDEARTLLATIIWKLKNGYTARISKKDKWGHIYYNYPDTY